MRSRIKSYIHEPYPFFHQGRDRWRIAGLILLLGFAIEYIIVPFNRDPSENKFDFVVIAFCHVGVAVVFYLCYALILTRFASQSDWNLKKEAAFFLPLFLLIGVGEWVIRDWIYVNPSNWEIRYLLTEVWHAILYGAFLMALIVRIHLLFFIKKDQVEAPKPSIITGQDDSCLRVSASVAVDHFDLYPKDLLCVRSDGNYLEFYVQGEGGVDKKVKRMTLVSATKQLAAYHYIFQCHRTYMINLAKIDKVEGNAQGYHLQVEGLGFSVPVARRYLADFDVRLASAGKF